MSYSVFGNQDYFTHTPLHMVKFLVWS